MKKRQFLFALIILTGLATQAGAAPTAEALGTFPNAYDAAISPDG